MLLSAFFISIYALIPIFWFMLPESPQFMGKAVHRVEAKEKVIALTFDDGPNPPYTQQVLEALKKHGIRATFFIKGKCGHQFPDLIKQEYGAGHELGNHTWSHRVLIGKSSRVIRQEIESTDMLLRDLGYTGPIPFRSPKGLKFYRLPKILSKMHRENILFDVIAFDWLRPGVKKIVGNVLEAVHPGSIVLLHDGGGNRSQTIVAIDIIIRRLKEQGYRFATISELLLKGRIT